jgi:hypothetical protein
MKWQKALLVITWGMIVIGAIIGALAGLMILIYYVE